MHCCIQVAMVYMPFNQVVCIHNMYTWLCKYVLSVLACTQQPRLYCEIQSNVLTTHAFYGMSVVACTHIIQYN